MRDAPMNAHGFHGYDPVSMRVSVFRNLKFYGVESVQVGCCARHAADCERRCIAMYSKALQQPVRTHRVGSPLLVWHVSLAPGGGYSCRPGATLCQSGATGESTGT